VLLSVTTSVEFAGTEIEDAMGYAVPPRAAAEYTLIVILAAEVVVLATTMLSTFRTKPLEDALLTKEVAEVVVRDAFEMFP
jgi:hypothetical protein